MIYLSEIHDPSTPGLTEVATHVREPDGRAAAPSAP
jgi:hypothetical protein